MGRANRQVHSRICADGHQWLAGSSRAHARWGARQSAVFGNSPSALLPQTTLLVDRAYDADWIRQLARQQGAWANIPPKRNRKDPTCFSPFVYRARNLIV